MGQIYEKNENTVSPLGESPKKIPARFPLLGIVSPRCRQAFPYRGMFQNCSGRFSPIRESSTEALANFPHLGTAFFRKLS